MSVSDWRSLTNHRQAILLGEAAGLLHDWQKCLDTKVGADWQRNPNLKAKAEEWRKRAGSSRPGEFSDALQGLELAFPGTSPINLRDLCQEGKDPSGAEKHPHRLVQLLGACHDVAHVEKELALHEFRERASDKISTPFGHEDVEPDNLSKRLLDLRPYLESSINNNLVPARKEFLSDLSSVFAEAWGDTRRPINEVTLWDWSYAVASLYKSELARHFLTGEWRERDDLRWRLLWINFDVLGLYSRAIKLADLFGYVSAADKARERVKHLVEDEYPLGNEVYRDTTGIYFTFPDVELPADRALEIRRLLEEIEPELAPRIGADQPTAAKDPQEQLRRLLADQRQKAQRELENPFAAENLSLCWQALWDNLPDGAWEVCPVCRLRPKDEEDEVCEHCKKRRASRIEAWHSKPEQTVWLDELADENDRLALIVGKFGLDDWLSGDLVQTLLVKCDPSTRTFTSKNASPARLRRVWETCQRFWEGTVSGIFSELPDRVRRELLPKDPQNLRRLPEGPACDGTLAGQSISIVRVGAQLLTTSYCAEPKFSAGKLRVSWEGPWGKQYEEFEIQSVREPAADLAKYRNYRPALTLLTSPDQFLALVPARQALNIASKTRKAYADEFGKVQNRLPLFLGLVFFQRKTPLFAAMDTARRMLNQVEFCEETWKITSIQNDEIRFDNGCSWTVPTRMADGSDDLWYPYLFVEGNASHFSRGFQCAGGKYKGRWLAHVSELAGSAARLIPSRFAYLFLEHTAQRFEFDSAQDVMPLDELPQLVRMWEQICGARDMTDTELRAVADLLQIKGERWGAGSDEFKRLVETTLRQAGLWEGGEKGAVTPGDATSGRFHRCLEIYLRILKERVKEEGHEQHASVTL